MATAGASVEPDNDLVLYCRTSHLKHYRPFVEDFCKPRNLVATPRLDTYDLTLDGAISKLTNRQPGLVLLEGSLPMAMAIVSVRDEFKIAGFLDVAHVEKHASSCKIYYHPSVKNNAKVKLLVPSLWSMTATCGELFVKNKLDLEVEYRPFPSEKDDPYDEIIDFVAEAATQPNGLSQYVWVIDEAKGQERAATLEKKIGPELFSGLVRKDLFVSVLEDLDRGERFLNHDIPGMFLMVDKRALSTRAATISALLANLRQFAKGNPDRYGLKILEPFQWEDLDAFVNLLEFAREIAKRVDERTVRISRPLQVYRDFADVSLHGPPLDVCKLKKAIANFCTLLYTELRRIHDVVDSRHSEMYVQMELLSTSVREADEFSNQILRIKNRLQDCQDKEALGLAATAQTEILDICESSSRTENNCINALRVVKGLSQAGWLEMANKTMPQVK
jgi:hypothetical protein